MTDYRDAVRTGATAMTFDGQGTPRGRGRVIGYTDQPQLLIEYPGGSKEWWLASLTALEPPAQASQDRPGGDETPAEGGTDGSAAPDASTGRLCTCDHHSDTLDTIRNARTLGGHAGIAEGLAAIAHAILATHPEEPR